MNQQCRRPREAIASDLWSKSLGLHHVGLVIDMIGDYALEGRSCKDQSETIFAAMAALAALNRETQAEIAKIGEELHTGERRIVE